jgi:lipoprotein NlpI
VAAWPEGWPKTVGQFLAGVPDEATLLAAAAKGDAKVVPGQQCEADYFIGLTRLIGGDETGARDFWGKCVATDLKDFNEYQLSKAELARLDAAGKK